MEVRIINLIILILEMVRKSVSSKALPPTYGLSMRILQLTCPMNTMWVNIRISNSVGLECQIPQADVQRPD